MTFDSFVNNLKKNGLPETLNKLILVLIQFKAFQLIKLKKYLLKTHSLPDMMLNNGGNEQ